jgi:hypothetical protein
MPVSNSTLSRTSLEDTARKICESRGGKWSGTKGMACCPAHDDRTPSLGVSLGRQATGVPVWATLGNERFGLVSVPESVTELHLFVDHDAGGELAASRGLSAYACDGRTVHVRKPSSRDTDWNDELTAWLRRKAAP